MYKIHFNVLPRILVLYDMFDFAAIHGQVFLRSTQFFRQVCLKFSNQALNRTRKTGHRKTQTRTQAHQRRMEPLEVYNNVYERKCLFFIAVLGQKLI